MEEKIKVKIKLEQGIEAPKYETSGSAGFDFKAKLEESKIIKPKETCLIPTGMRIALPKNYELQIRSRSGMSLKQGLIVLNAPGTVDSDYRGDIGLIVHNVSEKEIKINSGDRLAQGILNKVAQADFEVVEGLEDSERGEGGFGSTGK